MPFSLAELARGQRVLELGVGTGRVAVPLAARGLAVRGSTHRARRTWLARASRSAHPSGEAIGVPTTIKTERLVLRPFQTGDVEDALAYRDDVEFARFLPHIPQPFTRSNAERFVATNMTEPWDRSPTFAVVLAERVMGTVSFEIDATERTAMIGYAIGRAWWGRGFATEAARAAMTWAVDAFHLTRVWASTELGHVRSQRVLEKLGMRRECVRIADHVGRGGNAVDEVVYVLTLTA